MTRDIVQNHAPTELCRDSPVFVKIASITAVGVEDVYNMEVKDHHNFSICNGLIVHNCIDAVRYALENVVASRRIKTLEGLRF